MDDGYPLPFPTLHFLQDPSGQESAGWPSLRATVHGHNVCSLRRCSSTRRPVHQVYALFAHDRLLSCVASSSRESSAIYRAQGWPSHRKQPVSTSPSVWGSMGSSRGTSYHAVWHVQFFELLHELQKTHPVSSSNHKIRAILQAIIIASDKGVCGYGKCEVREICALLLR